MKNMSKTEVLYFSMACNEDRWNKIQSQSKVKGSISPLVFDSLLLNGLSEKNSLNLTVYSFPSIPAYPNHRKVFWGSTRDTLSTGLQIRWLPFINLHVLKQVTHFISSLFVAVRWSLRNKEKERILAVYSQYLPVSLTSLLISHLFNMKSLCIITDIPKYMFLNRKIMNGCAGLGIQIFQRWTSKLQRKFDKYVFLTEEMSQLINVHQRPYTIIEGIGDPRLFDEPLRKNISRKPQTIMYAGSLNKAVGMQMLMDIIRELPENYEFWIFGVGDYECHFVELALEKSQVKFFGKVSRAEILQRELQASLLINLRNPADELTCYSFPSKTIEYMSSGTPLLSTRLQGIPAEYYNYIFFVDAYDKTVISEKIESIFSLDEQIREKMGRKAQQFIHTRKNYRVQTDKLLDLINT